MTPWGVVQCPGEGTPIPDRTVTCWAPYGWDAVWRTSALRSDDVAGARSDSILVVTDHGRILGILACWAHARLGVWRCE